MLCDRERAGCKKQRKSAGILLDVGHRIGESEIAARRRGGLLHLVQGLRRCCIEHRPPLLYMVVAGKMGIEATLVNTVSNLKEKGFVGVWSESSGTRGPMRMRALTARILMLSG